MNTALTILAMIALGQGAGAQGSGMAQPTANEKSYTGCIEAAASGGGFTLTHVAPGMAKGAMGKDTMGKDAMSKDAMSKDSMGKDAMKKDAMAADHMDHDAMAPAMLSLASTAVDLSKHVGHKVTVTVAPAMAKGGGMGKDMPAMTVSALTMVAATCTP